MSEGVKCFKVEHKVKLLNVLRLSFLDLFSHFSLLNLCIWLAHSLSPSLIRLFCLSPSLALYISFFLQSLKYLFHSLPFSIPLSFYNLFSPSSFCHFLLLSHYLSVYIFLYVFVFVCVCPIYIYMYIYIYIYLSLSPLLPLFILSLYLTLSLSLSLSVSLSPPLSLSLSLCRLWVRDVLSYEHPPTNSNPPIFAKGACNHVNQINLLVCKSDLELGKC